MSQESLCLPLNLIKSLRLLWPCPSRTWRNMSSFKSRGLFFIPISHPIILVMLKIPIKIGSWTLFWGISSFRWEKFLLRNFMLKRLLTINNSKQTLWILKVRFLLRIASLSRENSTTIPCLQIIMPRTLIIISKWPRRSAMIGWWLVFNSKRNRINHNPQMAKPQSHMHPAKMFFKK